MFRSRALRGLLVIFVGGGGEESPVWLEKNPNTRKMAGAIPRHFLLFIFVVLLMTSFNLFSHGTQDIYPTFLKVQHKFNSQTVGTIAAIASLGAISGGLAFGAFSQQIGRRKAIVIAALLSILAIPLLAFSQEAVTLAIGAFLMQFLVQGAWGVIPAHLNELSPAEVRRTFPG